MDCSQVTQELEHAPTYSTNVAKYNKNTYRMVDFEIHALSGPSLASTLNSDSASQRTNVPVSRASPRGYRSAPARLGILTDGTAGEKDAKRKRCMRTAVPSKEM